MCKKKREEEEKKNYASTTTKSIQKRERILNLAQESKEVRLDELTDLLSNDEASHRSLHIPHRVTIA
jgi:hypothetical protein